MVSEPRIRVRSDDVVSWVRLLGDLGAPGWDRPKPPGLVILEGLHELGPGVHHERAVRSDRLPDRLAAKHQDVQPLARPVHPALCAEGEHVTRSERGQLAGVDRTLVGAYGA